MRVTVIPAEVTSVEDKILGNFSINQTALVALAILGTVFLSSSLNLLGTGLVISLIVALWVVCIGLAIRLHGTTVLDHIGTIGRYITRPRYYVYDKRSTISRRVTVKQYQPDINNENKNDTSTDVISLSPAQIIRLEKSLTDPHTSIRYQTDKKGKLYVHITKTVNQA